ncbi:MAG: 50S ribosomal protein L21 [Spartobacteria bacterium]|nr:50S ribosomal protein L21 [Spartobacteria bacterium]
MEAYAVIETGGKQYRVEKDTVLSVERLKIREGGEVRFETVLAVSDGKTLKVGTPDVGGVVVKATVIEHYRDKKVIAFKRKRRKGYKRKIGHRQELSEIKVVDIAYS